MGVLMRTKEVTHGMLARFVWSGSCEDLLASKSRRLKVYALISPRGALI